MMRLCNAIPVLRTNLFHQLEELHLIQSSLLPGEHFVFVFPPEDLTIWSSLLDAFMDAGGLDDAVLASLTHPPCQAHFQIYVVAAHISFEVELPPCTNITDPDSSANAAASVSVKGDHVSRDAQERWHAEIRARSAEIDDACASAPTPTAPPRSQPQLYHALLTSHHLISPTKRRSMHQWSSQLAITGFAKVGYPGIIYAEGPRDAVQTFVQNVKGMQWLALRVRFLEPVSCCGSGFSDTPQGSEFAW
ncbi:hypothetical protein J3R82DRAFT_97 [Butyriboletus roseoflavus]|nr:hypothetical protein J3R82DRAFT_97 [Butyriboletus roseoflavus]